MDLTRGKARTRGAQFPPAGQQNHHRAATDDDIIHALCGQDGDVLPIQPCAGAHERLTGGDIFAPSADIGARRWHGADMDHFTTFLHPLLHDHRIGTVRQRRASEDAVCAAASEAIRCLTGGGSPSEGKPRARRQIVAAHGIAIHRGLIEAGQIKPCADIYRQNPANAGRKCRRLMH